MQWCKSIKSSAHFILVIASYCVKVVIILYVGCSDNHKVIHISYINVSSDDDSSSKHKLLCCCDDIIEANN